MNRQLSAYLDLMRVVCAVVVVLSHLGHGHLVGGYLWPFTYFGNEAVMAFFVLSGFVIAFVTDQREQTLAVYAAARLARLYSVILPAMLLTVVLDAIGQAINAESYLNAHAATGGGTVSGYVLSAIMLNQSWGMDQHFGSDGAYWSIPYEFWYYFIFGAVMLLNGWRRIVFAVAGAAIAGPKILILLPVWLLGVAAYYLLKHRQLGRFGLLVAMGSLALLAFMLWADYSSLGKARFLGVVPDSLPWKYLTGLCIAVHIYGMSQGAQWLGRFFAWIARPLSFFSGSTLALYLFHLPVIGIINAVASNTGRTGYMSAAMIIAPFVIALTLGYWCELQKRPMRAVLLKIWQVKKNQV
ncbi:MAG: acyltransferase family protein [Rhodoferax sp.]|uniref:acyltransferase family protein n=1 Tax=Rhodoferax sp. TaxID=50421 RepID=UPI002608B39E|nr:acyltransferase family protein [Rhodoferax sp.]MDD2881500.1 acyltransferase family protein [Rhodoferax sp.]